MLAAPRRETGSERRAACNPLWAESIPCLSSICRRSCRACSTPPIVPTHWIGTCTQACVCVRATRASGEVGKRRELVTWVGSRPVPSCQRHPGRVSCNSRLQVEEISACMASERQVAEQLRETQEQERRESRAAMVRARGATRVTAGPGAAWVPARSVEHDGRRAAHP